MPDDLKSFVEGDLPGWIGYAQKAAQLASTQMRPRVLFGSPVQMSKNPLESWWHVSVTLKRRLFSPSKLEGARVFARCFEPLFSRQAIELKWKESDRQTLSSRITLIAGEVSFIPVVWREEGPRMNAIITDVNYINDQKNVFFLPPRNGQIKIKFLVKSGNYSVESAPYIIRNRAHQTNGHFVLEAQYEGLGTGAYVGR